MASVAGLAPARFCLKGRAREMLCIHGQEILQRRRAQRRCSQARLNAALSTSLVKWPLRLVSRQRLLVFSEALICLSYSGCLRTATVAHRQSWSSWQVTLLRLPVISRALCF